MNSAQKSDLADFWQSEKTLVMVLKKAISLIRDMVVEHCNRRFGYVYFNEFFANVLRDNMGMIIFDLQGCGGC